MGQPVYPTENFLKKFEISKFFYMLQIQSYKCMKRIMLADKNFDRQTFRVYFSIRPTFMPDARLIIRENNIDKLRITNNNIC